MWRVFFLLLVPSICSGQLITLVPVNANWKYLDNGSDQGTTWNTTIFNDAAWQTGQAELGYGDGDENAVVSYGSNSNNKHITTYFRISFTVANPALFSYLVTEFVRDDGMVLYLNGTEVVRSNMPGGNFNYQTLASGTIAWPSEDDWHTENISAALLVPGTNVLAVEIHQDDATSSDISFNLKLSGSTVPIVANVVRGPYLNSATPNSIKVRWRTDVPTDSKVQFGLSPGSLTQTATNASFTTEHEVDISALNPATKYFYNIGSNSTILSQSTNFYFKTHPVQGTSGKYKFWVIGDAGTGNNDQRAVRDAFLNYNANEHIDGWIMLGDNAYNSGYDNEYQTGVFQNMYEGILGNTVLWPAPGNHDYNNHIPFSPSPAYYDVFSLPVNAEAGGVASGTEKYYSYNFGNIHFVVLDSYDESRASTSAMANWLQSDLAANTQEWIIAYWHHPPYTKGSHDSDDNFLNNELVEMRENILPILENYGVDLILNGHSHCYERSMLIDGHYDYSNTLQSSMVLDNGSGNYSTECPYQKQTQISRSHKGTVYAVVGCSGKLSGTSSGWPHPVTYIADNTLLGSMILEIDGNQLQAKFLTSSGSVFDSFTILKNAGRKTTIDVCPGEEVVLHPSWNGSVNWFPGNIQADSLSISALLNTTYFASDLLNCVRDTFVITVLSSPPCQPQTNSINEKSENGWNIFPTLLSSGESIYISAAEKLNEFISYEVYNAVGSLVLQSGKAELKFENNLLRVALPALQSGIYFIRLSNQTNSPVFKFIIH